MPQVEPLTPPVEPREAPSPSPPPPAPSPPPEPRRKLDPFHPEWPRTRPTPEPKA